MAVPHGRSTGSLSHLDALSRVWPLPLGFLAGLFALPVIFRWLLLLLASLGKLPPNLGTSAQRPRKVGVALAIIHPVPWVLLLGFILGGSRIIASAARAEWVSFLLGVIAAPGLNAVLVYAAVRRARAKRRRETAP